MWPLGLTTTTTAVSGDGQHAVRPSTSGLLLFWIMLLLFSQHFRSVSGNETAIQTNADCPTNMSQDCVRCNERGCMKCPDYIMIDSRKCVITCPTGYVPQWSTVPDFMGRICYPIGLTGSTLATIVGIVAGVILCLIFVVFSIAMVKRKKRRKSLKESLIETRLDRDEFLKQLDELRPQSEYFLQMLNDTRRQIRKLHNSGDVSAAAAYHPVVRDLAKILILLNRPVQLNLISGPPHDWNRLLAWAELILDRYKPQLTQLIEFLQSPAVSNGASDPRLVSSQLSTFKHNTMSISPTTTGTNTLESSTSQAQQLLGSLISLQEFDDAANNHHNQFGDSFNHVKCYLSSSGLTSSSLFLEDEFFKLGFRPQDEITTEL